MSAGVEQDVVRLHVTEDDAQCVVHVAQGEHELRRVQPHAREREAALRLEATVPVQEGEAAVETAGEAAVDEAGEGW